MLCLECLNLIASCPSKVQAQALPGLWMSQLGNHKILIFCAAIAEGLFDEVAGVLVRGISPQIGKQHLRNELFVPLLTMLQNGLNHMVCEAMAAQIVMFAIITSQQLINQLRGGASATKLQESTKDATGKTMLSCTHGVALELWQRNCWWPRINVTPPSAPHSWHTDTSLLRAHVLATHWPSL